jgi:hypothetical protein
VRLLSPMHPAPVFTVLCVPDALHSPPTQHSRATATNILINNPNRRSLFLPRDYTYDIPAVAEAVAPQMIPSASGRGTRSPTRSDEWHNDPATNSV